MDRVQLDRIYALDGYAADFLGASQHPRMAHGDLVKLHRLAAKVDADLRSWIGLLTGLDCARPGDLERARTLVLESVFDDSLTSDACRVLTAELALLPD